MLTHNKAGYTARSSVPAEVFFNQFLLQYLFVQIMRKSLKAALLSALVFPGAGHFSLKKPMQGSLLAGIALICLYFLTTAAMDIAQRLSVEIQNGEVPFDVAKIGELVSQEITGSNGQFINIPSLLLVICWAFGVIDSFRIGCAQER